MKRITFFIFLLFIFSCKKEKVDPEIPSGGLYEIQLDGRLHQTVEYNKGKISRLSTYTICGKAYNVLDFKYAGDQLRSVRSGMRMFWPSWGEDCNTEKPFEYADYKIEYDAQGRYTKIVNHDYNAIYEYNGQLTTVRVRYGENGPTFSRYFKFDPHGNLIEKLRSETDQTVIARYEYDNNPNPLQGLNFNTWPDPFYGKNNVVRAFDDRGELIWDRKYTYDQAGRPLTCTESSGASFSYLYK